MDNFEQIFDNAEPVADAPEPVVTPEIVAPQPVEVETPAVAVEQPVEVAPREDNGRFAPISALQEERQRRQELQREAEELRAELRQRGEAVAKPKAPDPYDDPQGFAAFQSDQVQQMLLQERFRMSHEMAKAQYGADEVETARKWASDRAQSDPSFDLALGSQAHPISWIVQQHKRDGLLSQIGDDPDAYVRRRAVELGIGAVPAVATATVAPQPVTAASPPRSLAHAAAAGGAVKDIPSGPMTALNQIFR